MPAKISKLSVIVPAYNKDSEVFQVVTNLISELKHQNLDWELIVIDDCSRDKTLKEAIKSKKFNGNTKNIKIYSYNLNQGKGFALYYGFKKSEGDVIVFVDSDLDIPAQNVSNLIKSYIKTNSNIIIGSKRHPFSQVNYPLLRKFMSKNYQLLVKILFNLNVADTQVGLKLFSREVLEESFPRIVVKNFAFDLELLMVAKNLGYKKILEIPVILNYNFSSTIEIKSVIKILQDTLAIFYRKNFLKYYDAPHYKLEQDEIHIIPARKAFI